MLKRLLKDVKQEGRIRIYLISFVLINISLIIQDLPKMWMKIITTIILFVTYIYTTTKVAQKFATKKAKLARRKNE